MEPCYNYDTCKFPDIFVSCYFAMVTMTTVGYGDQFPTMLFSRAVATLIMLFGALFLSMPVAIVGSEFNLAWEKLEKIEGKDDETLRQELREFEMRKKRLGVNLITRMYTSGSKLSKRQAMNLIEKVTEKVLNQESQIENAETVSDTRFYLYEVSLSCPYPSLHCASYSSLCSSKSYLKISDHLNAIFDLMDPEGLTVEKLEWVLDVLSSCSNLMAKVLTVAGSAGMDDNSSTNLATHIRETHVEGTGVKPTTRENGSSRGRKTLMMAKGAPPNSSPKSSPGQRGSVLSGRRQSTRSFFSVEERSSGRHGSGSIHENLRQTVSSGAKQMAQRLGLNSERLKELQALHNKNTIGSGALMSVANVLQDGARATVSVVSGGNAEEKHFVQYICDAMYNDSLRDRLWLLLEVPER